MTSGAREMTQQARQQQRALPVGVAARANAVDHHTTALILNRIEDSIFPNANPVRVGRALQLLGVQGSGVVREGFDRTLDWGTNLMGQAAELSGSRRRIEDCVHGRVGLGLQRGVDLRHREESVAPMGLQIGEIPKIFEEVEESLELVERKLNGSPPSSDVHHVLGMQFSHPILTISRGNWRVKYTRNSCHRGQGSHVSGLMEFPAQSAWVH